MSHFLFNIVKKVLDNAIRQGKSHTEGREKYNFFSSDNRTVYVKNPKKSTLRLSELISQYSKVTGYQVNKYYKILTKYYKI